MTYFATFPSGFQFVAKDFIEKTISDARHIKMFDGAVIFKSEQPSANLRKECFHNVFEVLDVWKVNKQINNPVDLYLKRLVKEFPFDANMLGKFGKNHKNFRIIALSENQLVTIDEGNKKKLEKFIAGKTKLALSRAKADVEYWILYRNEGISLFLKRVTKHKSYERILLKGELHPEIAFMMAWMGQLKKNSVVLDPFCGSGAIPIQCARFFRAKPIYSFDNSNNKISSFHKALNKPANKNLQDKIICRQADFHDLKQIVG